jgi:hypothetical protein
MDELGNNDDIILIFSPPYFKSRYCMYELLQIWKKGSFQQRIHPILIEDFFLDNDDFQLDIIKHWSNEAKDLQGKLSDHNMGSTVALQRRQIVYSEISHNAGNLLDFVSNMLLFTMNDLRNKKFKPLVEKINKSSFSEPASEYKARESLEIDFLKKNISDLNNQLHSLKESYLSDYKDIAEWLSKNRESLVERIYKKVVNALGDLITNEETLANQMEIRRFKLNISHFIEQLEVCLLDDSIEIIDEPYFEIKIKLKFYEMAFLFLLERVPKSVSEKSVLRLKYYTDYLIERL